MKSKKCLGLLSLLFLISCTPRGDTPAFDNSPQSEMDLEACKNTSLTFKTVTAAKVRSLVNCLSANNEKLRPFKVFLDSASTEDLDLVFDAFTKHMPWGSTRHTDFLDLIKLAKERGYLKAFLGNFQILVQAGFVTNGVTAILPIWEKNSVAHPDPELAKLNEYFVRSIDNGLSKKLLDSSDLFSLPRSRALSALISAVKPGGLNSDEVTDLLSNTSLSMIADGTFQRVLYHGASPQILGMFKKASRGDRDGFFDTLKYFMVEKSNDHYAAYRKAQALLTATDSSMSCFASQAQKSVRKVGNLNRFVVDEIKGKSQAQNDDFLLKTVPLLLVSAQHVCALPRAMISNYDVVTDLANAGYSEAFGNFWNVIDGTAQFELLVRALRSPHVVEGAPLVGELSRRSALRALLDLAGDDLRDSDISMLNQLLSSLAAEKTFPLMVERILNSEPTRRGNLKALSRSVVSVLGDSRGGFGESLKILSEVSRLTTQKPVTEFLRNILDDKDLVNKTSPGFIRLVKNPNFNALVERSGELAGTGELERLIVFFVDLMRGQDGPPAGLVAAPGRFSPSPADGQGLAQNYQSVHRAPSSIYNQCSGLKGDVFEPTGDVLWRASTCLNSSGTNAEVASAIQLLKSKGKLPSAVKLLNNVVNQSPYTYSVLDELEVILRKGQMAPLLKMLAIMGEPQRRIFSQLDPLIYAVTKDPTADGLLTWLNWLSTQEKLNDNLIVLTDVAFATPQPVYQSQNGFRLQVTNPDGIKKAIGEWMPGASAADVEKVYATAKENFETHNEAWMYSEGSYHKYTKEEFRAEIVGLLEDLLRTTDLEEFIGAFQDFAKDRQIFTFLKDLSTVQIVTQNYVGDNWFVHIETGLDALENLVLNGDFGYLYVDNIGTTFQLSVVKSTDFPFTMKEQYSQLKLGAGAAKIFGPKSKSLRFKNMINNFTMLNYIAANGEMRVLQRLYTALYNATPAQQKENGDPFVNHMGLINRFNRLGFFANLSMAVQQTATQGQSDNIIKSIVDLALKVKPQDMSYLRKALQTLVTASRNKQPNALDRGIDLFWNLEMDPPSFEKFKTHLMHVALAEESYIDGFSPLIKLLPTLLSQKNTSMALVDTFFDDMKKDDSMAYTWSANLLRLEKGVASTLKNLIGKIIDQAGTPQVLTLLSTVYDQNSAVVGLLGSELKSFWGDARVKALNPQAVVKGTLQGLGSTGGNGSWPGLNYVLKNPDNRATLLDLGQTLSANGQIKGLGDFAARKASSGDAEQALYFLFDHFKKESLNFH